MAQTWRVLALGHCSSAFVVPLYREIHRRLPKVAFDVLDLIDFGTDVQLNEQEIFQCLHELQPARLSKAFVLGLVRAGFNIDLWRRLWWRILTKTGGVLENLREISFAARTASFSASNHYSLYHFHFCDAEHLRFMGEVPAKAKVICSFWGSDLLRTHGVYEYVQQNRALHRADAITIHSPELREVLLAKFGRHLCSKIHCARFPANEEIYNAIDDVMVHPEVMDAFRSNLKMPPNRLLVCVGHNGNPANNHLPIINALSRLSVSQKAAAVWMFPMKFHKNEPHIRAVEAAATAAGLDFRLITDYLQGRKLAAFRLATDILIHLPISDALSATVVEVIYGGNCVITGSWLPYSPFRKAQLPLVTVDNCDELPVCISHTLSRMDELKRQANETRQRIREHFFGEAVMPPWIEIYRTLLGLSR